LPRTLDPGSIGSLQALQVQRTPLAGKQLSVFFALLPPFFE
jgi:hypothetical protein